MRLTISVVDSSPAAVAIMQPVGEDATVNTGNFTVHSTA